ncbi:ABC transporter permease [Nocardioides yefusunii]|uniref:ABC transporter permease n=1 Tax=Nocardioides yefusunii TaxID=2500546 RepID=A0ABW1R210_9ACTN|nr:ABC transporter permease [Nocardioides yefusunii]
MSVIDDTAPARTTKRRRPSLAQRMPLGWIVPVAFLVLWHVAYEAGWINPTLLSSPVQVAQTLWESMRDGEFWDNLGMSVRRWILGFLIGGVLGLVLGALTGLSRFSERMLDSTLQMLRTIPLMGLVPLFIVWFGIGEQPKIILIAYGAFFNIYLSTFAGIRDIDRKLIEVGRVYELSPLQMARRIVFPAAMPQVLHGIRLSLGVAWLALVIAELNGASSGIGFWMQQGREFVRVDIVIAALVVFAVVGKLVDVFVRALERRLLGWRDNLAKEM